MQTSNSPSAKASHATSASPKLRSRERRRRTAAALLSPPPPLRLFDDTSNILRHDSACASSAIHHDPASANGGTERTDPKAHAAPMRHTRNYKNVCPRTVHVAGERTTLHHHTQQGEVHADENRGGDALASSAPPPMLCIVPPTEALRAPRTPRSSLSSSIATSTAATTTTASTATADYHSKEEPHPRSLNGSTKSSTRKGGPWMAVAHNTGATPHSLALHPSSTTQTSSSTTISSAPTQDHSQSSERPNASVAPHSSHLSAAPAVTSRVLFLHDAEEDSSSRDDAKSILQGGRCGSRRDDHLSRPSNSVVLSGTDGFVASQTSRGDSLSSRSPSGVSSGTAVPEAAAPVKETYLLELLTRAASTEVGDERHGVAETEEREKTKDAPPADISKKQTLPPSVNVWLRTPSCTLQQKMNSSINAVPVTAVVTTCTSLESPMHPGSGEGWGKRSAVRRPSRTPSPTRRAARSENDIPCRQRVTDVDGSAEGLKAVMASSENDVKRDGSQAIEMQEEQQQPSEMFSSHQQTRSSDTVSSPCEALRYSFPSLTINTSVGGDVPYRSHRRTASREVSPSLPRSLFSDAHICAAELPEPDMLSIAAAVISFTDPATTHSHLRSRSRSTSGQSPQQHHRRQVDDLSSPAGEALDLSSFRTPLSPCPSSVAPPFSVFPCTATSRVTSPVSIPAKMMKQRQREHARVRHGSASPASQMPAYSASSVAGGNNYSTVQQQQQQQNNVNNNMNSSFASGWHSASQLAQRESFGSLTMASVTTNSLPSAFASAVASASREVVECEPACDRSGQQLPGVDWQGDEDSTSRVYYGSHVEVHDEEAEGEQSISYERLGRKATSLPIYPAEARLSPDPTACHPWSSCSAVPADAIAAEQPCVGPSPSAMTETLPSTRRAAAAASLRIHLPFTSCPSTPPSLSLRTTSPDVSAPSRSLPPRSPSPTEKCIQHAASVENTQASAAGPRVSSRPSCCASPWSPTSTRSAGGAGAFAATPTFARPPSTSVGHASTNSNNRSGGGSGGGFGVELGWCPRGSTHTSVSGARCCSPPLPSAFMSASASLSCVSLSSQVRNSSARTPPCESLPLQQPHYNPASNGGYHPLRQQHPQQQRSEGSNFTPRMSSDDASRRSGRPVSSSPVYTGSERRRNTSFVYLEQSHSSDGYARLGSRNATVCTAPPAAAASGAAAIAALVALPSEPGVVQNDATCTTPLSLQQQQQQPKLKLFPSEEFEPLSFATQHALNSTPPPSAPLQSTTHVRLSSTCSTPPPTSLVLSRVSQIGSPCVSPPHPQHQQQEEQMDASMKHNCTVKSCSGGVFDAQNSVNAMSSDGMAFRICSEGRTSTTPSAERGSPLQGEFSAATTSPIHGTSHRSASYKNGSAGSAGAALTSRMSRHALPAPPRRSVRASSSPQVSFCGSPSMPADGTLFAVGKASEGSTSPCEEKGSPLWSPSSYLPATSLRATETAIRAAGVADVVGTACYGVESELCGFQSAPSPSGSRFLPSPTSTNSAPLLVEETTTSDDQQAKSGTMASNVSQQCGRRSPRSSPGSCRVPSHEQNQLGGHTSFIDDAYANHTPAVQQPADLDGDEVPDTILTFTQTNDRSDLKSSSAVQLYDNSDSYYDQRRQQEQQQRHRHRSHTNNSSSSSSRSSNAHYQHTCSVDQAATCGQSPSTCFSSSLQLVPPPPLVTLPRSSSAATSVSSPFSSTASPAGRVSRRGSPLTTKEDNALYAGGDALPTAPAQATGEDGSTSSVLMQEKAAEGDIHELNVSMKQCDVDSWAETGLLEPLPPSTLTAAEPRRPARTFCYAFSSLRGARSKQEDSVTLTPDLLIRKAVTSSMSTTLMLGTDANGASAHQLTSPPDAQQRRRTTDAISSEARSSSPMAFTCFGVFDGHCGDAVSSLASQYFPEHFEFAVKEYWAQWTAEKERVASAITAAAVTGGDESQTSCEELQPGNAKMGESVTSRGALVERTSAAGSPSLPPQQHQQQSEVDVHNSPAEFQRVISAALVQSLVHLDLTLYDALHQKSSGRSSTQRRDAGSTASVAAFFKVPRSPTSHESQTACDLEADEEAAHHGVRRARKGRRSAGGTLSDTYRLCIANLGDSRAIVGNKHTRQLLLATTDHRISACPTEASRIAAVGGVVELGRVDGSLDVTRGLGDYRYKVNPAQWWAATTTSAAASGPPSAVKAAAATATAPTNAATAVPGTTGTLHPPLSVFPATDAAAVPACSGTTSTFPLHNQLLVPSEVPMTTHAASRCLAQTRSTSSTSVGVEEETPHTEALSAVRALRWASRSTTPMRDSFEGDAAHAVPPVCAHSTLHHSPREYDSGVRAAMTTFVEDEESSFVDRAENREVRNDVNTDKAQNEEEDVMEGKSGGRVGRSCSNEEDGGVLPRGPADQWRRSFLNNSSSAATTTTNANSSLTASAAPHEQNTDRELFGDAATVTATAAAKAALRVTTASPLCTSHSAGFDDEPHSTSRSPFTTSTPGSPLQSTATNTTTTTASTALTGNAVSNIADVYEWEVHRDDVLIIASDGVWDSMSSEEVLRFVCSELQTLEGESDDTPTDEEEEEEMTDDEQDDRGEVSSLATKERGASRHHQQHQQQHNYHPFRDIEESRRENELAQAASSQPFTASSSTPSSQSSAPTLEQTNGCAVPVHTQPTPNTPTTPAPLDKLLQRTPLRQPTSLCHAKALHTPCGDGGEGVKGGYVAGTPGGGGGGDLGSAARSSAVQTAARRLTEYVVNTLSGNDNTTAIVVVFR